MSPILKALAERAIAAGAPQADDHTVIVVPGVSFRSVLTGLVYDRSTRLPLLSDSSWIGWTLEEAERRGHPWRSLAFGPEQVAWSVDFARGSVVGMPAALVAMLEATR